MSLSKKKLQFYLYIFFLILVVIFSKFSTNYAFSKNYIVSNIEIQEFYDLNFEKTKVIDKAFKKAFKNLVFKLVQSKDQNILSSGSKKIEDKIIINEDSDVFIWGVVTYVIHSTY